MRTLNRLVLVELPAFAPFVAMAVDDDVPSGEPGITIRQEGDETVQGYRVNSFLYAIRVVPEHGRSYFLVRAGGSDGNFIRSGQSDRLISQREIFSWWCTLPTW